MSMPTNPIGRNGGQLRGYRGGPHLVLKPVTTEKGRVRPWKRTRVKHGFPTPRGLAAERARERLKHAANVGVAANLGLGGPGPVKGRT